MKTQKKVRKCYRMVKYRLLCGYTVRSCILPMKSCVNAAIPGQSNHRSFQDSGIRVHSVMRTFNPGQKEGMWIAVDENVSKEIEYVFEIVEAGASSQRLR